CGSQTSTAPSVSNLPYREGTAQLQLAGYDAIFKNGTLLTGCAGIGSSGISSFVTVDVTIQRDGSIWRGRPSTSSGGTFELQLHDGVTSVSFPHVAVAGSIRGTAKNTVALPGSNLGDYVAFGPTDVFLDGQVLGNPFGAISDGTILGSVVFGGANGRSVVCAAGTVSWYLAGP